MKALVWHWGRRGAGPLTAVHLAAAINTLAGHSAVLSLAQDAEILAQPDPPPCAWRESTYHTSLGYVRARLLNPLFTRRTLQHLDRIQPDIAICAMPALLDPRMTTALRARKIPGAVVVHDGAAHPGESLSFLAVDQSRQLRMAAYLFPLTGHVEAELRRQGFGKDGQVIEKLWLPPWNFGPAPPPPLAHGGLPRLLNFGRLLPYKGLDLLAGALELLGPDLPFTLRVCGDGPKSPDLDRLQNMPNVTVERRWVPEAELPSLLAWADAVVLPYREASQSGVAAAAIALGRYVLATNVGGLPEQLAGVPLAALCEPTPAALAAAMLRIFHTPPSREPASLQPGWNRMAAALMQAIARPATPPTQ